MNAGLSIQETYYPDLTVVAHVVVDGRTCATGTALWKRWRPRA